MTDKLEAALRRMAVADPRADDAAGRLIRTLETTPLPPQKRPLSWWPAILTDWTFAPSADHNATNLAGQPKVTGYEVEVYTFVAPTVIVQTSVMTAVLPRDVKSRAAVFSQVGPIG